MVVSHEPTCLRGTRVSILSGYRDPFRPGDPPELRHGDLVPDSLASPPTRLPTNLQCGARLFMFVDVVDLVDLSQAILECFGYCHDGWTELITYILRFDSPLGSWLNRLVDVIRM